MTNNKRVSTLSKIISLICTICVVGLFFVATILGIVLKVEYGWNVYYGIRILQDIMLIAATVLLALYLFVFNKKQNAKLFCALPLIVYSAYLLTLIPGYFNGYWLNTLTALLSMGTLAMMVMAVAKVFTGKKAALFATIGAGINVLIVAIFIVVELFDLSHYDSATILSLFKYLLVRLAEVCFVAAVVVALWGTKPFSTAPATVQPIQIEQSFQPVPQTAIVEDKLRKLKDLHDAGLLPDEQYDETVRKILSEI